MAAPARAYNRLSSDRHLVRYLREVSKFPRLDAGEERALAKRWRENQEREASDRLVTSHLGLVVKVAVGFRGYGLPISDLIAEGNIGMMRAVDLFDPYRGFRLSTYAVWWIRAAIQRYILRNWSLVQITTTAAQKRLFFRLRQTKERIKAIEGSDLSPEQVARIASWLNAPTKEVVSMNRRLAAPDSSLNAPRGPWDEGQWQDSLIDDTPSQEVHLAEHEERIKRRQLLGQGLAALNTRERHIVVERHLKEEPATLDVLSRVHGVCDERIRQIEVTALRKLKKAIQRDRIASNIPPEGPRCEISGSI
jgi:RNA polymerase sigma-32 factor